MPNMGISRALGVMGLVLVFSVVGAQASPESLADYDSVTLRGKLSETGQSFEVEIRCIPFDKAKAQGRVTPGVEYLGPDGLQPACVLASPGMTVAGVRIEFPRRSYSDLADVTITNHIFVTGRGPAIVLHLQGGDGAGAYKVRFIIEKGRVRAREVEAFDQEGEIKMRRTAY